MFDVTPPQEPSIDVQRRYSYSCAQHTRVRGFLALQFLVMQIEIIVEEIPREKITRSDIGASGWPEMRCLSGP